jgi:hypothetical protein
MSNGVRLDVRERISFANGHAFDGAGPYERLSGRAHIKVDPDHPSNRVVVDLDLAPRGADGLVEIVTDFMILKPIAVDDRVKLFFDYGNRGSKRALNFFCDAKPTNDPLTLADAGNGFLFRRGYTIVWCGWQGDLLPGGGRMLLDLPVARYENRPVTGQVRTEFIAHQQGVDTYPLSGQVSTRSHPAVSLDTRRASLTRRRYGDDARIAVPPDQWFFARPEGGRGLDNRADEYARAESDRHIHMPSGFKPGWIYELVYTARDPLVLGLGHVAVRDFVSFLKNDTTDAAGQPNPVRLDEQVSVSAYCWGRSQTGRCIRDFIYLGFNADRDDRPVFDGAMPHVSGAGRLWLNYRFANVVSPPPLQYEQRYSVVDVFPYSYAEVEEPGTGRRDALLKRPNTDPLIMHTQSATEYWQRRNSLVHTDLRGQDLEQPENVRIYHWASSQHFSDPHIGAPTRGVCQNFYNPVQTSILLRAHLDALDAWVQNGTAPPASCYPQVKDGTLVDAATWDTQFPPIPGVMRPKSPSTLPVLDWGPQLSEGILSEPPQVVARESYSIHVPAVDADGNEVAGIRVPMVQAPLGTYTGWNLRARGFGNGALYYDAGSYIPFPETPQEREITRDPRPSILERYQNAHGYVEAIAGAARQLVRDGFMLEEDVERVVAKAHDWSRPMHDVHLEQDEDLMQLAQGFGRPSCQEA